MTSRRGLVAAVITFGIVGTIPIDGLAASAQFALATMVFAGMLWVTGALPLPVTALIIPVMLTVFGVVPSMSEALSGFSDPILFLLLTGFVLAEALKKHGTDRRVAYHVLAFVGTSPRLIVLAVMVATALLSMVVSNSATTAMMIPVALGLADQVVRQSTEHGGSANPSVDYSARAVPASLSRRRDGYSPFRISMLLGVAYAASIGGEGTLIGSPPNAIVVSQLAEQLDFTITFLDWLAIGIPFVIVGLPITWYVLTVVVYPPEIDSADAAREEAETYLDRVGPPTGSERWVIFITGLTAGLWLFGGLDFLVEGVIPARLYVTLFGGSGPHLFGTGTHVGVLYFVAVGLVSIPALIGTGTVEWDDIEGIDWGTIILLGGAISLANTLSATGASGWIAQETIRVIADAPLLVVALVVAAALIGVSEIASNTAMAAIFVPILIAIGPEYASSFGGSPVNSSVFLAVTGGIAGSFGFALPVATPPNAISFGTGHMEKDDMLKPGLILDGMFAVLTGVFMYGLFVFVWPVLF